MTLVFLVKTLKENLSLSKMLQRAGGWCEPEQADGMIWFLSWSCERLRVSNKTRLPPLPGRTLLEVREGLRME